MPKEREILARERRVWRQSKCPTYGLRELSLLIGWLAAKRNSRPTTDTGTSNFREAFLRKLPCNAIEMSFRNALAYAEAIKA